MESAKNNEPICCPEFNETEWHDKSFTWEGKRFIKDKVCTFFYMPLNFGKVITRMMKKVEEATASVPDNLCLSDHISKWNMDIYLAVDQFIPNAEEVALSGNYYARVYEGPFRDTEKWCKDYEEKVTAKGLSIKKWYMWYTTCPKCAKKYGKNPVVIICRVE